MGNHTTKELLVAPLLGLLPIPLLHTVSGSRGFWDEIVPFALIGAVLIALGVYAVIGGRRSKRHGK